jgi:hypothetical protein
MAADEFPPDALKRRFEIEDAFVSPVAKKVLALASTLPFGWPFNMVIDKIRSQLGTDSAERIKIMLETVVEYLRRHDEDVRKLQSELSAEASQARTDSLKELLLDGARKAEATRNHERIRRIGLILANATIEARQTDADEIEETMRVAMEVSDHEMTFLRELVRISGRQLEVQERIPRPSAHATWEHGNWSKLGPGIESVFSKLEGYGLVARIPPPNNLNIGADFPNRYVLLKKGLRFTQLARQNASESLF